MIRENHSGYCLSSIQWSTHSQTYAHTNMYMIQIDDAYQYSVNKAQKDALNECKWREFNFPNMSKKTLCHQNLSKWSNPGKYRRKCNPPRQLHFLPNPLFQIIPLLFLESQKPLSLFQSVVPCYSEVFNKQMLTYVIAFSFSFQDFNMLTVMNVKALLISLSIKYIDSLI